MGLEWKPNLFYIAQYPEGSSVLSHNPELSYFWRLVCVSHSAVSSTLWLHGLYSARFVSPWDFTGKNTGVGCQFSNKSKKTCFSINLALPKYYLFLSIFAYFDYFSLFLFLDLHCSSSLLLAFFFPTVWLVSSSLIKTCQWFL